MPSLSSPSSALLSKSARSGLCESASPGLLKHGPVLVTCTEVHHQRETKNRGRRIRVQGKAGKDIRKPRITCIAWKISQPVSNSFQE